MSADLNGFLVTLSNMESDDSQHQQLIRECLDLAARGIKYLKTPLNDDGKQALRKIATRYPQHTDTIKAMVPDIETPPQAMAPQLDWKAPETTGDEIEEGRPFQTALKEGPLAVNTCVWTGGTLSRKFANHCGAPQATMEERIQVRRERGYGSMPTDKPSLARTQPYCAQHLRASIQPSRRANLDYIG